MTLRLGGEGKMKRILNLGDTHTHAHTYLFREKELAHCLVNWLSLEVSTVMFMIHLTFI